MINNSELINQDSGDFEYYTPIEIVNAARSVMGGIDLDPASSIIANQQIKALEFYTKEQNGLDKLWFGKVWMNHPFSRKNNPVWINKLVDSFNDGSVTQACCITYASTSEGWLRPLMKYPQCFIYGRTHYRLPDGTIKRGVTKGSVVTYLGPNISAFREVFRGIGAVKV
jgi:hypothetical protein